MQPPDCFAIEENANMLLRDCTDCQSPSRSKSSCWSASCIVQYNSKSLYIAFVTGSSEVHSHSSAAQKTKGFRVINFKLTHAQIELHTQHGRMIASYYRRS